MVRLQGTHSKDLSLGAGKNMPSTDQVLLQEMSFQRFLINNSGIEFMHRLV